MTPEVSADATGVPIWGDLVAAFAAASAQLASCRTFLRREELQSMSELQLMQDWRALRDVPARLAAAQGHFREANEKVTQWRLYFPN